MIDFSNLEAWFVTGSQHLYGPEMLKKVDQHATAIAAGLGKIGVIGSIHDCLLSLICDPCGSGKLECLSGPLREIAETRNRHHMYKVMRTSRQLGQEGF
jgi:hypothetical protein